jgi:hypothetical protein
MTILTNNHTIHNRNNTKGYHKDRILLRYHNIMIILIHFQDYKYQMIIGLIMIKMLDNIQILGFNLKFIGNKHMIRDYKDQQEMLAMNHRYFKEFLHHFLHQYQSFLLFIQHKMKNYNKNIKEVGEIY